jgi:hypothetical protein
MNTYGTDEYGRYIETDGERYAIERWPYKWPPHRILVARWYILRWHLARNKETGWRYPPEWDDGRR